MNQIIKYRALRTDGKGWAYGFFFRIADGKSFIMDLEGYHTFEVIPETVGHFTGFLDVKDVEIYEGDKFQADKNNDETDSVVMFDSKSGSWQVYSYGVGYSIGEGGQEVFNSEVCFLDNTPLADCLFLEVMGNIHEDAKHHGKA